MSTLKIENLHVSIDDREILKGIDLEECATTRDRNNQIGGHKK